VSKHQQIRIVAESAAAPSELFPLLADGRSWVTWSPMDECVPEGLGPNGEEQVGTIRANRMGRTRGWDRITSLEPDRVLGYAHLKGLPVRNYLAEVTLEPKPDGGTTIIWTVGFHPRWPGTGALLRRNIEGFLRDCVAGLAAQPAVAQ
jgi:hypothetical protein